MKFKRIIASIVLAASLLALSLPVGAASSSFTDVKDGTTAINTEILRLMGVVSGYSDGSFRPDSTLTRAEFCAMSITLMGLKSKVPLYTTRTIFPDVTASHWARGYVNLAASTTVSTGKDTATRLISGVGDGTFAPDSKITYAQAVTILIRVLGYGDDSVGAVWPAGYLNLAKSIGLTDGLSSLSADAPLNRAQAAQLFVNTLSAKKHDGTLYYKSLGTAKEDVILLAVNVSADDKSQGAIRTSVGTYLPAVSGAVPSALQGRRGVMVLNERNEMVTFLPDDSTSVSITLSGNAQAGYVKGASGTQYTISSNTPVYTSDKTESTAYSSAFPLLTSGSQVTLFSYRGKVVGIYAGGGTSATADAVVVMGSPSEAMFHQLTGGVTGYTITKNRQPISMSGIQKYDVVTYDSIANTLVVSDLRLTCVYEDAIPNSKAPQTIKSLGYSFPVLESAWDSIAEFSVGGTALLLLTADGKVAGMVQPNSQLRSNAIGMVTGANSVKMYLPSGGSIDLAGSGGQLSDNLVNQLVTLSSTSRGRISASKLSTGSAAGDLDLEKMTLGSYTVTRGVRVFEQVSGGAMAELSLSGLDMASVPANKLAAYHLNSSGMVDYVVLDAVTGDAYVYGKLVQGEQAGGSGDLAYVNRTVTVDSSTSPVKDLITGFAFKDGAFGGVVKGLDGKAAALLELTAVKGVSPSDFFESKGRTYVTVKGNTYLVSDGVECYKNATKSWFLEKTGAERLAACKAFSSDLTLYLDPMGQKVRVLVAN